MWSLSGHHYGDKETMHNCSDIIIFSGDVRGGGGGGGGDGTQGGFNIKVMTTKRPCIPVAPLRYDRSTFTCTKIFIMVAMRYSK